MIIIYLTCVDGAFLLVRVMKLVEVIYVENSAQLWCSKIIYIYDVLSVVWVCCVLSFGVYSSFSCFKMFHDYYALDLVFPYLRLFNNQTLASCDCKKMDAHILISVNYCKIVIKHIYGWYDLYICTSRSILISKLYWYTDLKSRLLIFAFNA